MFEDLFYGLAKGAVVFFLVFVAYLINLLILQPLKFRKKFSKYPNVYISEKFNPLVGDMNHEVQCVNEGKVHYAHYAKRAHILAKYDLQAKLEGIEPVIMIISDKACKQFCSFMPRSIDRINAEKGINVLLQHSLIVDRSDKRTMARRKNFSSWIGLNSASKYIPRTVGFCQDMLEAMTTEGKTDLLKHLNKL